MKKIIFFLVLFWGISGSIFSHNPYTGSPMGSSWCYKSNTCTPTTSVTLKNQITSISSDYNAIFRVKKSDDSTFSSSGTAELWDENISQRITYTTYLAGVSTIDVTGSMSYFNSGTHRFVVKLIPSSGCTNSLWTDKYYVTYSNSAPSSPSPIQEPQSGYAGETLYYTYQISDSNGDRINMHVNWGDGSLTWESNLVNSGSIVYPSHSFSIGSYTVSTRGFDEHGLEGPLRTFPVNISAAPTVPSPPQNITATPISTTTIRISWNTSSGATSYKVTNKNTGIQTTDIYATSYDWTGLNSGQNYCFTVKACNSVGCSPESNQACATTQVSCLVPSITSISPSMVAAGSGAGSIYINGTNFSNSCEAGYPIAYIGNVNQTNVAYVNSTQIRVDYSSINDVSGFQDVLVKNAANSTYWATRSDLFRIVKVSNVQPGSGSFPMGSTISVSWTCNAPTSEPMIISIKRDACNGCSTGPDYQIIKSNTSNDGSEPILIPAGITQASDWRIFVRSSTTQAYGAGGNITITAPHKVFTVDSYWHSTAYPNHWLDTGIDVSTGQQLFISATGQACLAAPNGCFGPDGDVGGGTLDGCKYGSLVGKIGTDGSIFCLGANYQGTMPATGRLFFGYNDSDYDNNSGSFNVGVGTCSGTRLNNPILNLPTEGAVNVGTPTSDNTMASVSFSWNLNNPTSIADSWLSVRNLTTNHIIFSQNVGSAQSYILNLRLNTEYRWSVMAMPKNTSYCSSDGAHASFTTITSASFYKNFIVDSYWHSTGYPNHWLDTGIDVSSGQQLTISASDQACFCNTSCCYGPDGYPELDMGTWNGCHYGALVGKIGSSGSIFCLGANYQGTMPATGRLYLGYNDSDYDNNSGSFKVGVGACTGTRLINPTLNLPAEGAVNVGTPTADNTMASVSFSWNLNNPTSIADSWLSVRNLSNNHIIFSQNVGSAQSYILNLGLNTEYRWSVMAMPKSTSYCSSDGAIAAFTTTGPLTGFRISGKVFDMNNTSGLQNVTIRIQGNGIDNSETRTAADGAFTLGTQNPLAPASYTITPSMTGKTFYPSSRTINIASHDATEVNFYTDNEVPVVLLTSPASGASVSGAIFFQGAAYTNLTFGEHSGIDTITVLVDGVQKAWGYLPVSDYTYSLGKLTWHDVNGIVLNNWSEILPATGLADVQVAAVGYGGKVGYSPITFLTLVGGLNVTITSPLLENMPLLRDSQHTANSLVTGGTPGYTYKWFLDDTELCSSGCSDSVTFTVDIFSKYLNLVVEDAVGNIGTARLQLYVDTPSVSGDPESLRQASAGYGVNVANGNFFMQRTDLTLPAVGLPIVFTRTYNSCRFFSAHDGPLGKGWTHSYDIRLKASGSSPDVQVTWGDGMEETWLWIYGVYRSANMSNFSKLQKSGDEFIITDKNQIKYYFDPETAGSENYHLSFIEDPQANRITLTYTNGILTKIQNNTSGRFITLGYDNGKLVSLTDNAGRMISYSYINNFLTGATDLRGKTEQYQYVQKTDLGAITNIYLLSTVIDKKQNTVLTNTYDLVKEGIVQTRYRCVSQTIGADQTYSFNYANNSDTVVTNPLNQATHFYIDSADRVTDITNTFNSQVYQFSIGYEYSGPDLQSKGLPTKNIAPQQNGVPNPAGTVMGYSTDGQGNLLNLWEPNPIGDGSINGPNHRFEYITDTAINKNLIKTYIDPDNKQYDFSYYPNSLLQTITFPESLKAPVTYTYNSNGQLSTMTTTRDGSTQIIQYRYENGFKDLTQTITPLGYTNSIVYNNAGQITSVTDALGKVSSYTYEGNLIKTVTIPITAGRNGTTTYTYDDNGRLTDILDPMGKHTVYEYDLIGRLIKETNAAGNIIRYQYDKLNRLYRKTFTNSALHPIQYNYNEAGNMEGIQNIDLAETMVTYTYDKNGNVKTETDGLNRTKTNSYDNMDRLTRIDYADGTFEKFDYNSRSLVEHYTDRRGNITDYVYDSLGRLKTVYEPVEPGRKVTTEITYDTVGNIKEILAPGNKLIRFEYDNDNRLTKRIEDPNGAALQFSYTYYNNNHLQTYTADGLSATYDYYDCGWLKSIAYTGGTTIQLTYNDNGFLTGMTDGAGNTVYGRDEVGRMLSRIDPFGNQVGYHYDAIGRLDVLTYPGNKTVGYTYDAAHRMKIVTSWLGMMATYNYNAAGQLNDILNGNNTTTTFAYQNTTGRLTGISHKKANNTVIASYQFTLDGNGNRESSSVIQPLLPLLQPRSVSYTYDGANRLQIAGDKTFNFNNRGVLTGFTSPQGNYSFTFDILDRLTSLTGPNSLSASFVYDGMGNRLSQTVNGSITRYVVDANKSLSDVLMEMNSANVAQGYYIYGLGLIARTDGIGSNPKYYHFDGTGSTAALTDNAQTITDAYAYDPFGNVIDQFGTTPNPFKYVGQYGVQTAPAGLQYMRARYYMPEIGRFISRDKVWGKLEVSQSMDLFAYANNNPVTLIDPGGLYWGEGFINSSSNIVQGAANAINCGVTTVGKGFVGTFNFVTANQIEFSKNIEKLLGDVQKASAYGLLQNIEKTGLGKLSTEERLGYAQNISTICDITSTALSVAELGQKIRTIGSLQTSIRYLDKKFLPIAKDSLKQIWEISESLSTANDAGKLLGESSASAVIINEEMNSIIYTYWKKYNEKQLQKRIGREQLTFELYKRKWGILALKKYFEGK